MSRPPLDPLAAAVGPGLGEGVHSGSATIEPTPVPGLPGTVVWLVRDDSRDHPMQAYVGHWPDGQVRVLSDHQDAWADLARDVGAHIDTVATALGYVRAFLECTRGSAVAVREITAADELPWRPGSPDEERRRAEFLGGPPVPEPRAVAQDGGFHVELTLIVGQRVQRNLFDVTAAGAIDASFSVLADDLPLPIVR